MVQESISIQQAAEQYISDITWSKPRNTVNAYTRSVTMFLAYIKKEIKVRNKPVSEIYISHFTSFIYSLKENGYSKATFSLYVSGLKSFLRWLLEKGYITAASHEYQAFLETVNSIMRAFQKIENKVGNEEITPEILINAAKHRDVSLLEKLRDVAITYLLLSTNCRPYEIVLLRVCDLDLKNHTGIIHMGSGKTRNIIFDPETSSALSNYWRNREWQFTNDPAFARHDKGAGKGHQFLTTRSIQNIIQNIKVSAGFEGDITADQFRKFHYLKALDYIVDISSSSELLDTPYFYSSKKYYPPEEQ